MKREIITLAGSTRFTKQFKKVAKQLTLDGKIVFPLFFYQKTDRNKLTKKQYKKLFELQLDRIAISDGIFVIDINGYIGNSTKKEIEYAKKKGKFVRYYSKWEKDEIQ